MPVVIATCCSASVASIEDREEEAAVDDFNLFTSPCPASALIAAMSRLPAPSPTMYLKEYN
jgi:hypothetical protein